MSRPLVHGTPIASWPVRLLKAVVLIIFCAAVIIPFLGVISTSLAPAEQIARAGGLVLVPESISTDAYQSIFAGGVVTRAIGVSTFVTVVGTLLGLRHDDPVAQRNYAIVGVVLNVDLIWCFGLDDGEVGARVSDDGVDLLLQDGRRFGCRVYIDHLDVILGHACVLERELEDHVTGGALGYGDGLALELLDGRGAGLGDDAVGVAEGVDRDDLGLALRRHPERTRADVAEVEVAGAECLDLQRAVGERRRRDVDAALGGQEGVTERVGERDRFFLRLAACAGRLGERQHE
jgi:hypothetical protein